MSFLSSVLKSISRGDDSSSAPVSRSQPVKSEVSRVIASGVKRKAETELERPSGKIQRTNNGAPQQREIKPLPQRALAGSANAMATKSSFSAKIVGSTMSGVVRGDKTSSASLNSKTTSQDQKLATSSRAGSGPGLLSKPRPITEARKVAGQLKPGVSGQASAAAGSQAQAQPKKGSFKDLMARAKAAQTVAVGKITHKPVEKLSKKERLALTKGQPTKGKDGSSSIAGRGLPPGKIILGKESKPVKTNSPPPSSKYQGTSKPKAPIKSLYQGTAKPSVSTAYKGTSKSGPASKPLPSARSGKKADRNEYLGTDEEDEGEYGYDDDSEAHYEENSDDFSDMDAGFDEIGDEEEEAERQAKRDDVKEQKLLEKLAREKAERKKGRF